MRYYIDTEFLETGRLIDPISIGVVCEDGREYYAQSCEFIPQKANKWVKEYVYPHLLSCPYFPNKVENTTDLARSLSMATHIHRYGNCVAFSQGISSCPWKTRAQLAHDLREFIKPGWDDPDDIELWGWCAAYDYVALCQLYGGMMHLPAGWPHYMHDLQDRLDLLQLPDSALPQQESTSVVHHALEDARHIKRLWEWIQ